LTERTSAPRATATWKALLISLYRLAGALAILVAIGYQVAHESTKPGYSPADYFSYFTELSNLFAAGVLLFASLSVARTRTSTLFQSLRGAAVLYMLTTGIVYAVLLSGHAVSLPWVNTIVHRVMPVVLVLDWLADPPIAPPSPRQARWWLAFPVVYLLYTLLRGSIVHWYPYQFLDPRLSGGYPRVLANGVGIALGQILMGLLILQSATRLRGARSKGATLSPATSHPSESPQRR
jgi:hypothetical protein